MSYYFFKGNISSFLDDADVNLLGNWAWKVYWQCYAAAQEYSKDGLLPPVAKLAFRIRADEKRLADGLQAMSKNGLAIETEDGWVLTRFAAEQEAVGSTERVQAHRKREREKGNDADNEDETDRSQSKKREEEEKKRKEEEEKRKEEAPNLSSLVVVRKLYEQNIGPIVPEILTELENATAKYPLEWIKDAVGIAVKKKKHRWDYVSGILKNWQTKGRGSKKTKGNGAKDPDRYLKQAEEYADVFE